MGGPCPQCEHYRVGSSIARAAFAGVLPAYQPKLRQAQTLSIQQESQSLATFVQEQGAEYPDVKWLARPTSPGFNYCGLDEFDGLYYKCEVKNAEETCPDFTPRAVDAAPRPCSSCRHHRPPLGQPVRVLEETFRRYGQRSDATLNQEIRSLVQMQAEGEYQDCVDFAGFLPKLPAFLPVCMVRGSPEPTTGEPRCIVGPVVNSAARCSEWSAGTAADAESAQLDALVRARAGDRQASGVRHVHGLPERWRAEAHPSERRGGHRRLLHADARSPPPTMFRPSAIPLPRSSTSPGTSSCRRKSKHPPPEWRRLRRNSNRSEVRKREPGRVDRVERRASLGEAPMPSVLNRLSQEGLTR